MKRLTIAFLFLIFCTYYYPNECEKIDQSFRFTNDGFEVVGTFYCKEAKNPITEEVFAVNKNTPSNKVRIVFAKGAEYNLDCNK